ncbi:MAG: hypothetical protein L0Z62_35705 [Gemmataceae bacterium]|nr:hypothetical protein [Gemmataceae bacterium]
MDDLVQVSSSVLATTSPFSVAAWIKPDALGNYLGIVSEIGSESLASQFLLRTYPGGQLQFLRKPANGSAVAIVLTTNAITAGVWTHVAAVFAGGTDLRIFINGAQAATTSSSGTYSSSLPTRTRLGFTEDESFDGLIDEVGLYNRALSAAEIQALAAPQLNVRAGGALTGNTTIHADVVNVGRVAPGDSPGIITINGNYVQSGGTLDIETQGTNPATPDFDQLIVNGTVTLAGTLNVDLINDFWPSVGNTFRIIDNDGTDAISGTFAGLPEGATFTADYTTFQISHVGGTGNDVVLTVTRAPFVVTNTNDAGAGSLRQALNGDTPDALGGSLTFSTPATADSPVGAYAITPSGLTSSDYDITYVSGTLTVTHLALQGDQLVVGGTPGNDLISFLAWGCHGVMVHLNGQHLGTFDLRQDGGLRPGRERHPRGVRWFVCLGLADGANEAQRDKATDLHAAEFAADLDWIEQVV